MRKLILPVLAFGLAAGCGSAFTATGTAAGGGSSAAGATGSSSSGGASEADSGAAGAIDSGSGGKDGSAGSTGQAGSSGKGGGAGSSGQAGTNAGGSGGGSAGGGPTCTELFSRAKVQLDESSVCDTAVKPQQCAGTVTTTCGCEAPVEKNDSNETKAYLSTLAQISQKNCHQNCPLIACVPVTNPKCSVPVGSTGTVGTCANGLP